MPAVDASRTGPAGAPRASRLAIPAAFLLIDLVYLSWVWVHFPNWGIWDWDFCEVLLEAARGSIVHHHQLPLWNPFLNGGFTLVGHPEVRAYDPSFAAILAFGTIPGVKLCILVYLLVAQWGAFRLARAEGLSVTAAFLAAIVFSLSGWYAQHIAHGHFTWIGFAWTPFVALAIHEAASGLRLRSLVLGGIFCGLTLLDGGPYQAAFLPLFMALYGLLIALRARSLRPLWACGAIGVFGLVIAAVQILPIAEVYSSFPRKTAAVNYFYGAPFEKSWLEILYQGFVSRAQAHDPKRWMPYVLNVGSYVGWLPLLLAAAALALRPSRVWPCAVTFALATWIFLGPAASPDLWSLLHRLPVFGSLQIPARFNVFAVLMLALLAAHGLDALAGTPIGARLRWAGIVVTAIVVADMAAVDAPVFKVAFAIPPVEVRPPGAFFDYINSPYLEGWRDRSLYPVFPSWPSVSYASTLENTGVLRGWNELGYRRNALARTSPHYAGEVYAAEAADLVVADARVTPNRIDFTVSGDGGHVVINQNYDPGWKVVAGEGEVMNVFGRVGVRVPPGEQRVSVAFRPASFAIGATLSLAGLLGAAFVLRPRPGFLSVRRGPRRRSAPTAPRTHAPRPS